MSVIDRLPEHLKNRKTAEAVTAPSALLLAGAGTAAGVLIGAGLPLAILVGAVAYGVGWRSACRASRVRSASTSPA